MEVFPSLFTHLLLLLINLQLQCMKLNFNFVQYYVYLCCYLVVSKIIGIKSLFLVISYFCLFSLLVQSTERAVFVALVSASGSTLDVLVEDFN